MSDCLLKTLASSKSGNAKMNTALIIARNKYGNKKKIH